MKRLIYILPVLVFAGIVAFFLADLYRAQQTPPDVLPSALIGKPVPNDTLPALDAETQGFGPKNFRAGKVIVVNVFSSTCAPCRLEAPVLDQLAKMGGITLYGFVWRDSAKGARGFLNAVGDPFSRIGFDADGRAGIDWGVYGWPETYVVDGKGVIRFKYVGALTDAVVADQLLPAIDEARAD